MTHSSNSSPASEAQRVLSYYALGPPQVLQIQPLDSAGGWSGSKLWRITATNGQAFCLRRWPTEHPTEDRLRLIHNVLRIVADSLPIVAAPVPTRQAATFVRQAEHYWELTPWMPGEPDLEQPPNAARIRASMHALARFHDLSERFSTVTRPAPAILDRLRRWQSIHSTGLAPLEHTVSMPLGNEIDEPAHRLLSILPRVLNCQGPTFQTLAGIHDLTLQPAIRDIHREHLLFTGDELTGLIDFGALRIDTPLADVARLTGSFASDDAAARHIALNAYSELRLLSPADRVIIDALDASGTFLAAINWLTWLYVERRDMGPAKPISQRLVKLLARLQAQPR
jgi:homoserine kinase type II